MNVLLDAVWKAQSEGAKVEMDHWAQRYPTNTEDVARICLNIAGKFLEKGTEGFPLPPILQFSSEDRFTKYEICEVLAEVLGLPLTGVVANTEGGGPQASVQRPYDTHLSNKSLTDLGIDVWTQDFKAWWSVFMH